MFEMVGGAEISEEIAAEKQRLRKHTLGLRRDLDSQFRKWSSHEITKYVKDLDLVDGQTVSGFWPIQNEIDPRPLMEVIRGIGHDIALPVVKGGRILFKRYSLDSPLEHAGYGTMGPGPNQVEIDPDVLLVPLAAFDRSGGRIGYGKGYYDSAISRLNRHGNVKCIGVAFSLQEVDRVPVEAHDVRLSHVLTESGLLLCGRG